MKIKLYYDSINKYILNSIKYENYNIYIDEEYRLFFNKLTDTNNIVAKDFFVVDYNEFNTCVESNEKKISSVEIEQLMNCIFLEMSPENSLQIFLFFQKLKKEKDKMKKIEELINECIEIYSEKDKNEMVSSIYRESHEAMTQILLVLDNLLFKNREIIANFIQFYIDLLDIYYKNDIDRVKLNNIMARKEILEKNKLVANYEENYFKENICDITITKKLFMECYYKLQEKINLLLIIFEEQIFFLTKKKKKEKSLQSALEEKNGKNTYFSFVKKYEPYFNKIFIQENEKNILENRNTYTDLCFFKANLFRIKIYFYLVLIKKLEKLILRKNINLSEVLTSNNNTCRVLKSNYSKLNRELSFKHFMKMLNYLKGKEKEDVIIKLFNLYSQYNKINMEEIYFFGNILEYEMRFPFLEVKTRIPNEIDTDNLKFYNKEILKVEYIEKDNCVHNSIYVLERNKYSFDGSDIFIGKFLIKLSETEYLFEDVITKKGTQMIFIKEEYKILGELLKIEFKS